MIVRLKFEKASAMREEIFSKNVKSGHDTTIAASDSPNVRRQHNDVSDEEIQEISWEDEQKHVVSDHWRPWTLSSKHVVKKLGSSPPKTKKVTKQPASPVHHRRHISILFAISATSLSLQARLHQCYQQSHSVESDTKVVLKNEFPPQPWTAKSVDNYTIAAEPPRQLEIVSPHPTASTSRVDMPDVSLRKQQKVKIATESIFHSDCSS